MQNFRHQYEEFLCGKKEDATKFLEIATREQLISLLEWNDPNGFYNDEQSIKEFGQIGSLEDLKEAFWNQWEDQTRLPELPSAGKLKLVAALKQFNDAAQNLTRLWDEYTGDGEDLADDYPFSESFDDLAIRIQQWTNANK